MKELIGHIHKVVAPLKRSIMNSIVRGVIQWVDDTQQIQVVQISLLANEVKDGVEHLQNFGFTSVPLPGAEAVMVCVGGNRDHGLVLAVDDRRFRLVGLPGGSVAIYSILGNSIVLTPTGQIVITAPAGLIIDGEVSGGLTVNGDITATGNIKDAVRTMAEDRVIFDSHTHPVVGSTTGVPNQVE